MWPEGAVLLGVGGPFQEVLAFHQSSAWSPWPGPSLCLPPGDLPDLGIEPASLMSPALAGRFFTKIGRAHV